MNNGKSAPLEPADRAASPAPRRALPVRLWKTLRSVRFAILLMAIIVLASIVGTLIRQEPFEAEAFVARYGRTLGLLIGLLGLNALYHTWWFVALLVLFALTTSACVISRMRLNLRLLGTTLAHGSILLIVAGAVLRGAAGVSGLVSIREGETVDAFRTDGGTEPLGAFVRLEDFVIERYDNAGGWVEVQRKGGGEPVRVPAKAGATAVVGADGTTVEVLRQLPHFVKSEEHIYSASDDPVNPAVQVRQVGPQGEATAWLFARFPEFAGHTATLPATLEMRYIYQPATVKTFESRLAVLSPTGEVLRRMSVRVNSPVRVGRYTLYQSGYDPETETTSTLEVSYDPGVTLVLIGFALMPAGMAFTFYVRPLLLRRGARDA
jgi:hypothetical protein